MTSKYRRGPSLLVAGLIMLAITLFVAFWKLGKTITIQSSDIETAVVRSGPLNLGIKGLCKFAPRQPIALTADSGGIVQTINSDIGADVDAGSIVVVLENPDLREKLRSASSNFAERRIDLSRAESGAHNAISEARTTLLNGQDKENVQRVRVTGLKALADQKIISSVDYEEEQLLLRSLQRQNTAAKERMLSAVSSARSVAESNKILLNNLYSDVRHLEQQVDRLRVASPINGVVLDLGTNVSIGTKLNSGDVVARVAKKGDLVAICLLPSELIVDLKVGAKASLRVESASYTSKVERINPQSVRGETEVRVAFDASLGHEFRPGQAANLTVVEKTIEDAIYVQRPAGEIPSPKKKRSIYVLDSSGRTARQREVTIGSTDNESIEVLAGLTPGETIIVSDTDAFSGKTLRIE